MIKLRLTLDPRELAARLAHEADHEQVDFFRTFLKELREVCDTNFAFQTQLCFIANQLSPQDREDLAILGPEPDAVDFCTNLQSLGLMPADAAAAALNVRFPDDPPYTADEVLTLTSRALAKLRRLAARFPRLFDLMLSETEQETPLPQQHLLPDNDESFDNFGELMEVGQ